MKSPAPGSEPAPLQRALAGLQRWVDEGLVPGVAAVIAREGRLAGEYYAGSADGSAPDGQEQLDPRPVRPETQFCLASLTKLYTACAATTLVQDGFLALDESLTEVLTDLPSEDRAHLSLRRLLTHTSGMPYDLGPEENARVGETPTLQEIFAQYARMRPIVPPGSQVRYSNMNYGLLAQVVERIRGEPFSAFLQRRVFAPLGLTQTALPPPADSWDALATVGGTERPGAPNEPFNSSWWRSLGLPYGGAISTAREVARFMSACLAEAPVPGFLSPSTLDLMTQSHTGELAGGVPGFSSWPRADWGLGFEIRGEKRLHPFGDLTSPEAFGHLGASGTMAWADPQSATVCVVLTNRVFGDDRARRMTALCRFSNAVSAAAD